MNDDRTPDAETTREPGLPAPLASLTLGIQENDCRGVITYANRALQRILGHESDELLGRRIWDLLPTDEERASLRAYLAKVVREQPPPAPYLTPSRRKDGGIVQLRVDWDYKRDRDGDLLGIVSVITDVSDRTQAESLLEKRSQGLAAFLEVSKSFTTAVGLETVLQATVQGVTMLIGFDSAAVYLVDGDMLRLEATVPPLPPDFPDELRDARLADHPCIAQALRLGRPVYVEDCEQTERTAEELKVTKLRNLRTLLYVPLVWDEERLGAFIVGSVGEPSPLAEDEVNLSLTLGNLAALAVKHTRLYEESRSHALRLEQALVEQVRAEEERERLLAQLAEARRMESIGRLAGGVAHDFNNLLGVILGYAELALDRTAPHEPQRRDLEEILDAARRSADITRKLLAFARRQTINPRALDLDATVAGMLGMLRRLAGEAIDLEWRPGAGPTPVFMDPSQLDQILVNLCANARDAIAGEGRIVIETTVVRADADARAGRPDLAAVDHVVLAVSDDGRGMDDETLGSVFEPFFTTKDAGKGTGLGLATVYGIVKQNGGYIDVDSEPAGGSTFRIHLPAHDGLVEPVAEPGAEAAPRARGETVLVVEDEESIRRLVQRLLERLGYTVLVAGTPSRAVALARDHAGAIDLLLTDVVMPGMNGHALARQLQERHPGLAVLYMSGHTTDVIAHRGVLEEGVRFVQKPFTNRELAAGVRDALDEHAG